MDFPWTCGRKVNPSSISTPRYLTAACLIWIFCSCSLNTGGLAFILSLSIMAVVFSTDMVTLVNYAHSSRKAMVSDPLCSICLLVLASRINPLSSAKAISVTPSGKFLVSSVSNDIRVFQRRGPRTDPCGHPLVIVGVTVTPSFSIMRIHFDRYDFIVLNMVLLMVILFRFWKTSGHHKEAKVPFISIMIAAT